MPTLAAERLLSGVLTSTECSHLPFILRLVQPTMDRGSGGWLYGESSPISRGTSTYHSATLSQEEQVPTLPDMEQVLGMASPALTIPPLPPLLATIHPLQIYPHNVP